MKLKTLLSIFVLSLNLGAMAADQATVVTLYNSESTLEGGGSTIAVLRQVPRRAELFSCQKRYKGALKDFTAVEAFFNEGLNSPIGKRMNCLKYDSIAGADYLVQKKSLLNDNGLPLRYVYSGTGSSKSFNKVFSDVSTWMIDVNDGLGVIPSNDVLLIGARVTHENIDNPTISSFRDTYKLAGMAQILYPAIEK